jgi:hypothetical protein
MATGGGMVVGGGSGGGAGMPNCDLAMCEGWQECQPTEAGGQCIDPGYQVTWVRPVAGQRFRDGVSIEAAVAVVRGDGSQPSTMLTRVPVSAGAGFLSRDGGLFVGTLGSLSGTEGPKHFVAGWPDAGKSAEVEVVLDKTAPDLLLGLVGAPMYQSAVGFLEVPPQGSAAAIKKDEVVTLRVTSAAEDVDGTSLQLRVTAADAGWDAGAAAACDAGAFCRDFRLALGPQPMNAFVASVSVEAEVMDTAGNVSARSQLGFEVTRWKWARRVSMTYGLRTTPALTDGGLVVVGISGMAPPNGLVAVRPDGTVSWGPTNDGAIEGSPSVGRGTGGAEYVFYQVTTGENSIRGAHAVDGAALTNSCDGASAGTASSASLAVLQDRTASVMGVGIQRTGMPNAIEHMAVAKRAMGLCSGVLASPQYATLESPSNVVAVGDNAVWADTDGAIRGAWWNGSALAALPANFSVVGVGKVNGLAVLSGSVIAGGGGGGGGGGPGIGRLFAYEFTTGTNAWMNAPTLSTPTSGPIVVDGGVIGVVRTSGSRLRTIRLAAMDGSELARTADLLVEGGPMSFSGSQVPTPVAGRGGLLYVADNAGRIAVLPQQFGIDAGVTWGAQLPSDVAGTVSASLTLDCNRTRPASGTGILYLATETGWLVAYIVDSAGLDPTAPWPKYQRDAWNTGNFATQGLGPACP